MKNWTPRESDYGYASSSSQNQMDNEMNEQDPLKPFINQKPSYTVQFGDIPYVSSYMGRAEMEMSKKSKEGSGDSQSSFAGLSQSQPIFPSKDSLFSQNLSQGSFSDTLNGSQSVSNLTAPLHNPSQLQNPSQNQSQFSQPPKPFPSTSKPNSQYSAELLSQDNNPSQFSTQLSPGSSSGSLNRLNSSSTNSYFNMYIHQKPIVKENSNLKPKHSKDEKNTHFVERNNRAVEQIKISKLCEQFDECIVTMKRFENNWKKSVVPDFENVYKSIGELNTKIENIKEDVRILSIKMEAVLDMEEKNHVYLDGINLMLGKMYHLAEKQQRAEKLKRSKRAKERTQRYKETQTGLFEEITKLEPFSSGTLSGTPVPSPGWGVSSQTPSCTWSLPETPLADFPDSKPLSLRETLSASTQDFKMTDSSDEYPHTNSPFLPYGIFSNSSPSPKTTL